jgi:hypothetical protein
MKLVLPLWLKAASLGLAPWRSGFCRCVSLNTWPKFRLCESTGVWTDEAYPGGAMADAGDAGSRYLLVKDGNCVLMDSSLSLNEGRADSGVEIPDGRIGGSAGAGRLLKLLVGPIDGSCECE